MCNILWLLLQDVRADIASGHDLSAGAGNGVGPSAGAADGQERLPTSGKGLTSHRGSHSAAAAEVNKGRAQHSMRQAAAKVHLFMPALRVRFTQLSAGSKVVLMHSLL